MRFYCRTPWIANPTVDGQEYRVVLAHWLVRWWCQRVKWRGLSPDVQARRNFAITLPALWGQRVDILTAQPWIDGRHLAHEAAGHGHQRAAMGWRYLPTYLAGFVRSRGEWAAHPMEIDAMAREAAHADRYPRITAG
jgi:hypothetical protein